MNELRDIGEKNSWVPGNGIPVNGIPVNEYRKLVNKFKNMGDEYAVNKLRIVIRRKKSQNICTIIVT